MDTDELYEWCSIPVEGLMQHAGRRIPLRLVQDSAEMGKVMAQDFVDILERNAAQGAPTAAIVPCGPNAWYQPFTDMVNERGVSLRRLEVFHMDECLDWQGRPVPEQHPLNFRSFMEQHFYGGIKPELAVPQAQRHWLLPVTADAVRERIAGTQIDITLGGWGQDGHVAYNQARRHPYCHANLEEVADCSIHVQENNLDTVIALAHRNFGAAYQFVPPMSITLGMRECLSARQVRLFSDTGAWKQTALRVALFSEPTAEYPITLLQRHPDALITATLETARHPISEHPEWRLF
jgi:glucosamine-6-phosphate deaminase